MGSVGVRMAGGWMSVWGVEARIPDLVVVLLKETMRTVRRWAPGCGVDVAAHERKPHMSRPLLRPEEIP